MKREIKYPLNGLAFGSIAGLAFSLIDQYMELKDTGLPFWQNVDSKKILKHTAIGGGLGLIAGYGYYQWEYYNESKSKFEYNKYVREVLNEHAINKCPLMKEGKKVRDDIKNFLQEIYRNQLSGNPMNWGSTALGTGINTGDYDLLIPFAKNSFVTLQEMYYDLYNKLNKKYKNAIIIKQGRSIGLDFISKDGNFHIDVVPGREINNFSIDHELNLYVKGNLFKESSRIKTNTSSAKEITTYRPKEREVVKLMKIYRDNYGFNINSTFLQHLVMEAFNKHYASYSTVDNLYFAMDYLRKKLSYARIVDPGNSNNIISQKVDNYSRNEMVNQLAFDLNKLKNNKHYLKEIFPI